MNTTGSVYFSIIFVDFVDAPATYTPAQFMAMLAPAPSYYESLSYGAMTPIFTPLLRTLHMSKPSTAYSFASFEAQRAYMIEAAGLAVSAGWNFSTYDSIVVMATPAALPYGPAFCALPGQGFTVSGRVFENGATSGADFPGWGSRWANHELGHTMGLVDLYAFDVNASAPEFRFTGDWSLMGNIAGAGNEYFAWERWLLGWIPDDAAACAGAGTTSVSLTPIEQQSAGPGGARLVVAPIGATQAVVVEARTDTGADSAIPQPGLLVYLLDSSVQTGYGPLRVLPYASSDGSPKLQATLAVGKELSFGGVTVKNNGAGSDGGFIVDVQSACSPFNCFPPARCNATGDCTI